MKKFLAAALGFVALGMATPSNAADLGARPYAAPVSYIPAMYDWSGFYIGANGGYASNRSCWNEISVTNGAFLANEGCHDATGGVVGGQLGYRAQFGGWVVGVEAQGDWANLRGSNVSLSSPAFINRTNVDSLALFTGQVGYAWNSALLYVKGGAALIDDKYDVRTTVGNTLVATSKNEYGRWGGTAGVGLEYGFATNWSAAVEYDRLFMQSRPITFSSVPATALPFSADRIRTDIDMVTVRVNYRWGGPVMARY